MQVEKILVTVRVPTVPYAYEEVTFEVRPEEGDSPEDCVSVLRSMAYANLGAEQDEEDYQLSFGETETPAPENTDKETKIEEAKEQVEEAEPRKKSGRPKGSKNVKPEVKEKPPEAHVPESERIGKLIVLPVEPPEEPVMAKGEEKKAKAKLRVKNTPYDRSNELHKKLFGEQLDTNFPDWKSIPGRAKDASIELAGMEFLDGDGKVLPEFTAALKERME